MKNKNLLSLISTILLFAGILNLSYGYYTFLRIFITCSAIYFCYYYKQTTINNLKLWSIVFLIIAILFNPLFPIYLDKNKWKIIDFLIGILFIFSNYLDFQTFEKKINRLYHFYKTNTKYSSLELIKDIKQLENAILIISGILEQDPKKLKYKEIKIYGEIYTTCLIHFKTASFLKSDDLIDRTNLILLKRFPILKTESNSKKIINQLFNTF